MANIMSQKEFMERTYLLTRARSKLLKEVDSQLDFYIKYPQPQNYRALRLALTAWMDSKGIAGAWTRDERNKKGAVSELWDQLHASKEATEDENAALAVLENNRKEFLVALFTDARLESHFFKEVGVKVLELAASLPTVREQSKNVSSVSAMAHAGAAQKLGAGAFTGKLYTSAWSQVSSAFEGTDFADILHNPEFIAEMRTAIGVSLEDLSTGMVAGAGLIKSGGETLWAAYKTGKSSYTAYKLTEHKTGIAMGDPMQAFTALQEVIDREIAQNALILATHAAETGAKAGGMFADLGVVTTAAVGLAGTIARMLISLGSMARDWKERYRANQLLQDPGSLDARLFTACPILGCYFLCCADTSTIVSLMFSDIVGKKSFKDTVNSAVSSKLEPTLKIANHAIYAHRYRLGGKTLPKLTVLGHTLASSLPVYKATGAMALRGADWTDRASATLNNIKGLKDTSSTFR